MARVPESTLVAPCRAWLSGYLGRRFRGAEVDVLPDTERRELRSVIDQAGLSGEFPEASAWEVQVDVVGVVRRRSRVHLSFVELKSGPIKLVDVGQLLGYCRVCRPSEAFVLSPVGPSADLRRLLTVYERTDILTFGDEFIRVGVWNLDRGEPDWGSLSPPGAFPTGE